MVTDEQLDLFRIDGIKVRVVRDADPQNDVRGVVVAWDDHVVMIRKSNRKVVKLNRSYIYQSAKEERPQLS